MTTWRGTEYTCPTCGAVIHQEVVEHPTYGGGLPRVQGGRYICAKNEAHTRPGWRPATAVDVQPPGSRDG